MYTNPINNYLYTLFADFNHIQDISYSFDDNTGKVILQQIGSIGFQDENIGFSPQHLSPFDLVFFSNKSNLSAIKEYLNESQMSSGDFPIPALAVAYASKVGDQETFTDAAYAAIDVGSMVLSGGTLAALSAAQKARKIFALADISSSGLSLATTYAGNSTLISDDIKALMQGTSAMLGLVGGLDAMASSTQKQVLTAAKNHVNNLPSEGLALVKLTDAKAIAAQTSSLPPNKMFELIKSYTIGDPSEIDFVGNMNSIQGFYVKAAVDARSAGKMDDVATFYAALEQVRKYRQLEPLKDHIDDVSDLWQDVDKLDLFISDLASNENLLDFFKAADDAARLKYAKAWESISSDISVRINDLNINKIDNQVSINNTQLDRIKESFNAAPNKQKYIDEIQPKQTFHDNAADNVNGPISETQDQIDELLVTNNPINNTSKKFWWNHESNVNLHLDNIYGAGNVGRQITVDITTTTETFTVRLDNIIDEVGGKVNFKIGDAKSSINNNLSSKTAEQLRNSMSTPNQMKLYNALESGTIIQAKPRGERARIFFNVETIDDLYPINLSTNIDFYVNDSPASAGYNIYKKTLEL